MCVCVQVAALRMGISGSVNSTVNMSDEEIARALATSQPSDLLIKG